MGTARRLHGCEPRHRPRTLAALRDFCTRAKLESAKIYAVDPRDVVRDARDRGLVTSETCEQLLEHLRFAKAPDGSRKALLPTEWPSEAHFGWVRSLPKCHEAALAVWFLHAAHLLVTIALEDLLASVVAEGLCQISDDTRTSDRPRLVGDVQVWAEPWTANEDPSLTVKSALLTALPETNCAFARVQEVRKEHDPAFARWMPHMNFIYPFLPSGLLQVEEVAAKLASRSPSRLCSMKSVISTTENRSLCSYNPTKNLWRSSANSTIWWWLHSQLRPEAVGRQAGERARTPAKGESPSCRI